MKKSTILLIILLSIGIVQSCAGPKTCPTYSQSTKTNTIFLI
jgi:hypothetical protein